MRIYDFEGKKNISGERIREARLKLRLSQSDLAARVQVEGVTMERDSISRIEIGTRLPARNTRLYVLGGGVRDSFRPRRMSHQKNILSFSHEILDICGCAVYYYVRKS